MGKEDEPVLTEAQMADLSALADGSLAPERSAEVQALVDSTPELRAYFDRERQLVERLHAARAADRAPLALRERIEGDRTRAPGRARRWPRALPGAAGALAVAALVLALALGSGGASPTIAGTAKLAARGPSTVAPVVDPGDPSKLTTRVGSLAFPARQLGMHAVGVRTDRLAGRRVVTVYYAGQAGSIAYSIVATPALSEPDSYWAHGASYHLFWLNGRRVVVWRKDGHTCVISSTNVPAHALATLV
jgi:anti-sigma factor RsiW